MSDIIEETRKEGNFTEMVYADALFFQRGLLAPTIRVQAPSIAMVFADGVDLGADLSGYLLYSNLSDLQTVANTTDYTVSEVSDNTLNYYAKVEFRKGLGTLYAVFLARDPNQNVNDLLTNGWPGTGNKQWAKLDIGYCNAVMEKSVGGNVTITAPSIHMKATFAESSHFTAPPFSVNGSISYSSLSEISKGTSAGCFLDDHFYFSEPNTNNFKAFFMPFAHGTRIGLDSNPNLGAATWVGI